MLCLCSANPFVCHTSFTSASLLLPSSSTLVARCPPTAVPAHCRGVRAVGLGRKVLAKCYKGLVFIPSPVPWTVLLPLNQDGALSHRNRNKWLEAWEREGRGKLLNRALVLNTSHHGSVTSSPTLIMLPLLHRESLCVYMKKTLFLAFFFSFWGQAYLGYGHFNKYGLAI